MTLVQASIANSGNSVILIADRLLTRQIGESKYEFEWGEPKIIQQGKMIGIGFAGISYYADVALSKIEGDENFDEICNKISECIKNLKQTLIERQTKHYAGLSPEQFFEGEYQVPNNIREMIYGVIGGIHIEFECLITGFDSNKKARIAVIDNEGDFYDATNFVATSIGSGMQFSQMFFDMYDYNMLVSEIEGLFFAYRAKKWGEAPTGVGKKTDILICRKDMKNVLIKNESDLMKKIDDAFEKEKAAVKKNREKILEEFKSENPSYTKMQPHV